MKPIHTSTQTLLSYLVSLLFINSFLFPYSALGYKGTETTILYVSQNATGSNDGTSWNDAYNTLHTALLQAQSVEGITQIWVAEGTYFSLGTSFTLVEDVQLYGGFSGNEKSLPQRDWNRYKVILRNFDPNVHHILTGINVNASSLIDGVYFRGGKASGSGNDRHGSAIYLLRTDVGAEKGPTIRNCTFYENSSPKGDGGAIYLFNSTASFQDCVFFENVCKGDGGAVCVKGNASDVQISGSLFYTNVSLEEEGGALAAFGKSVKIDNSLFLTNKAKQGGGIYTGNKNQLSAENIVVYQNRLYTDSEEGSGIKINGEGEIVNSIIWQNPGTQPVVGNDLLSIKYSVIQGGYVGPGNLNTDPQFLLPEDHNFGLTASSPAVDAGLSSLSSSETDFIGQSRIQGEAVDMGAYELSESLCLPSGNRLYVDQDATGTTDGSSWTNAFTDLQEALTFARTCGGVEEIWIAEGTYVPTRGLDRNSSFHLVNGVSLYGGFSGTETELEERKVDQNLTILSGDQGIAPFKSFHVVIGNNIDSTTTISGLVIRDGASDFQGQSDNVLSGDSGAGMLLSAKGGEVCNPILFGCGFIANRSVRSGVGGGLYLAGASPSIDRCLFEENFAEYDGGAIMIEGNQQVRITNSYFYRNSVFDAGGAVAVIGAGLSMENCLLISNFAETIGGGAIYFFSEDGKKLRIVNSNFIENSVDEGEGAALAILGKTEVINSIFLRNGDQGNPNGDPDFMKFPVDGNPNDISITYSIFQGGWEGKGNLDVDPVFTPGSFQLAENSPAINVGLNSAASTPTDFYGESRKVGSNIDIGVSEFQDLPTFRVTQFVLIDAVTDQPIGGLNNGDIIDWRELKNPINIEAKTEGEAKSVQFSLEGKANFTRTENVKPWAMLGDNKGNFKEWRPSNGKYTLTATPYDLKGAVGQPGEALSIAFEVIGRSNKGAFSDNYFIKSFPNPADETTTFSLPKDWYAETDIILYDQTGRLVLEDQLATGVRYKKLDVRQLPAGIYILKARSDQRVESTKLIIEK
ncbi:MAG: choice-of-anchor Q domain-containing protein [Bacteroidota bacterium]